MDIHCGPWKKEEEETTWAEMGIVKHAVIKHAVAVIKHAVTSPQRYNKVVQTMWRVIRQEIV